MGPGSLEFRVRGLGLAHKTPAGGQLFSCALSSVWPCARPSCVWSQWNDDNMVCVPRNSLYPYTDSARARTEVQEFTYYDTNGSQGLYPLVHEENLLRLF